MPGIGKFYTPIATGGGTDISDANALVGDVALGKTFYAVSGGKKTGTLTTGWNPPSDWIDISTVANNEINLLVGDFGIPTIAFAVTVAASGTYSIDWGDGTVETARASATTYQHSYTVGAGTSCSLGYTTFKIRIYGASGDITRFQVKRHNVTTNVQYTSLLSANFGTTALTTLANTFSDASTLYSSQLQNIVFPSSLNSCTTMNQMCYSCYELSRITLPTSMSALTTTGLGSAFFACVRLQILTLPTTIGGITDVSTMCYNCYSLLEFAFPSGITTITNITQSFFNNYSLQKIVYPTTLNSLTAANNAHQNNINLVSVTLPTSMSTLATMNLIFAGCFSLPSITLPTTLSTVTDCTSWVSSCYALKTITNLSALGKTTTAGCNFTTAFDNAEMLTSITNGAFISKFSAKGTSGKLNKLNSLRLTNTASTFGGTSPQIDVSYTSLGVAALHSLFKEYVYTVGGKTIAITGSIGATPTYSKTVVQTIGSNVSTCSDTSNLVVGMYKQEPEYYLSCVATASTDTIAKVAHGLPNGKEVVVTVTGNGLTYRTLYYVINTTADTFQLSLTAGGSAMDITSDNADLRLEYQQKIVSIVANTSITFDCNAVAAGSLIKTFGTLSRWFIAVKGVTVTG